jgi:excisionase family DNA binding protein
MTMDRYLTVRQVADRLGMESVRFPRRLIEERRIEYAKFGTHVRIKESVLEEYTRTHTIAPAVRALRGVA